MENISLNVIMIKDPKIGGYTAFFKQLPDIISEGETQKKAVDNLIEALKAYFSFKSKNSFESTEFDIIERPINFALTDE